MYIRIFLLIFFVSFAGIAFPQQKISNLVDRFLNQPEYKNASIGIHIKELKSGETIYDLDAEKLFIPASTLKLVTSAVALEKLGAGYRFETRVGYAGKIEKDGTLKGDLVVIGGGDPVLGSEYFKDYYFSDHFLEEWARQIKNAGIKRIDGGLILDQSLYDNIKVPPTWIWEDMGNYYGASPNALTVYDNLFRISFQSPAKPDKKTKIVSVNPEMDGLKIQNEVLSSNTNRDLAYVFGSPLDKKIIIRGTIPRNRKVFSIKAAMHLPEEMLAKDILYYFALHGILISGPVRKENVPEKKYRHVYSQWSPELKDILKVLNHESVNLIAEHLVKHISLEINNTGNRKDGLKIIQDYLRDHSINEEQDFMEDGSGLSHFNAFSPKTFTNLLSHMAFTENGDVFFNSLPNAGVGTLYTYSSQEFPGKTLLAKSGSMTRVRCYSGYLTADNGKTLVFSIMVNHFSGTHSKLIGCIEEMLKELKQL